MSRRREVFPTDEIPHIWFHQTNKDQHGVNGARNPQGNLYTLGNTLYSYRDSAPIARIYEKPRKGKVVLLASSRWSVTTNKHQSMARRAIPDSVPSFEVPCIMTSWGSNKLVKDEHRTNIKHMLDEITEHLRKYSHARLAYSIEYEHNAAIEMHNRIAEYCAFFGVRCPKLPAIPELSDQARQELRAKDAERKRTADERKRKAQAAQRAKDAKRLQEWLDGMPVQFPQSYNGWNNGERNYARLRIVGTTVETSQGARVPMSHAKRVLALLETLYTNKREYQRNGHTIHLGSYAVDSFKPDAPSAAHGEVSSAMDWILTAGCHRITWTEIQRIAHAIKSAVCDESAEKEVS